LNTPCSDTTIHQGKGLSFGWRVAIFTFAKKITMSDEKVQVHIIERVPDNPPYIGDDGCWMLFNPAIKEWVNTGIHAHLSPQEQNKLDNAVPNTRKVNNYPLSSDITLSTSDIGNASLAADTTGGMDISTPIVASASLATILQTIWNKIRQLSNVIDAVRSGNIDLSTPWQPMDEHDNEGGFSGCFRKNKLGEVEISFSGYSNTNSRYSVVPVLPVGFRPAINHAGLYTLGYNTGDGHVVFAEIYSNGDIGACADESSDLSAIFQLTRFVTE